MCVHDSVLVFSEDIHLLVHIHKLGEMSTYMSDRQI